MSTTLAAVLCSTMYSILGVSLFFYKAAIGFLGNSISFSKDVALWSMKMISTLRRVPLMAASVSMLGPHFSQTDRLTRRDVRSSSRASAEPVLFLLV
jgi:hypothetical protein